MELRHLRYFIALAEELEGDPEDEQPTHELQEIDREQVRGDDGERGPQRHRGTGAEHDAELALAIGQPAHRERDHDGVVAGEHDVDPDDIEDGQDPLPRGVRLGRQRGGQERHDEGWRLHFPRRGGSTGKSAGGPVVKSPSTPRRPPHE